MACKDLPLTAGEKWGLQSYIHMEISYSSNLSEFANESFPS